MSLTVAELKAMYVVDEGPLDKSLAGIPGKVAKVKPKPVGIDGDGRGFDRAAGQVEKRAGRLSQSLRSTIGAIAGYFAFDAVIGFIGDSITAASDLQQTISTSSVIFGRNADEIDRWARGAARSVGLSRQAATEAAIGFGDMFQQLGFARDAATDMSTETVQLAADLGAFRGLTTADVVDKITAAFRGEYDSLQALIPNINAARVETEALAATGKANAAELTAQEKAAATLAIVQKDGAAAAGAFARESEQLAGSQQTLTAEWENAKARLGELLVGPMTGVVSFLTDVGIPAFLTVVGVVGDFVGVIADVPGPVLAAVAALTAFHLLRGPLSTTLDAVAARVTGMATGVGMAARNMGGLRGAASGLMGLFGGPWGVALAAGAAAFFVLKEGQDKFRESSRNAAVELRAATDAYGDAATSSEELGRRLAEEAGLFDGLAASRRGANDALEETGGIAGFANDATGGLISTLAGLADQFTGGELAARGFTDEIERQAEQLGAYGAQGEAAADATRRLNDLIAEGVTSGPEYEAAVRAAAEAQAEHEATTDASAEAVDEYRGVTDEATAATDAQKEAVDRLKSALDRFLGIAITTAQAQIDVNDGLRAFTDAVEENGTALDANTAAGDANRSMILDQILAVADLAEATLEETGSVDKAREAYEREMGALRRRLVELGYNEAAVDSLIGMYGRIPEEEWTRVRADTASATASLLGVTKVIDSLPLFRNITVTTIRREVWETVGNIPLFGGPPRREHGGPVWPGQTFLVGEDGPELVRFGASGFVTPADVTARLLDAGNRQAAAGLTARAPVGAVAPAPAAAADSQSRSGWDTMLNVENVNLIEGTPTDVARQISLEMRTRGF